VAAPETVLEVAHHAQATTNLEYSTTLAAQEPILALSSHAVFALRLGSITVVALSSVLGSVQYAPATT